MENINEMPIVDYALNALRLGLSVMPACEDGTKKPFADWKKYQSKLPDIATVRKWYATGLNNIGFVCGAISGNLEVLDFDDIETYYDFKRAAVQCGLGNLIYYIESGYLEHSPKGVHWFYRCSQISGNTKLASRKENDTVKVLIETRGEGGYIIAAPSCGKVNPNGEYKLKSGGIETIPVLTPEERQELHRVAMTFDKMSKVIEYKGNSYSDSNGIRPGDDYASKVSWEAILTPHGWSRIYDKDGVAYWTRPGKTHGISATTDYENSNLFFCFSTSTPFNSEQGYNKFAVYTILNHNGNFETAAKTLLLEGFGNKEALTTILNSPHNATHNEPLKNLFISESELLIATKPLSYLIHKHIEIDTLGVLFGDSNIGKSFIAIDLSMSVATGTNWNGLKTKKGIVLYVAGEGRRGIERRIRAWRDNHSYSHDSLFYLSKYNMTFIDEVVASIVKSGKQLESTHDSPVRLVIIDTLARHIDGDENSTRDMTKFVNLADQLKQSFTDTVVLIVHHTGKADKNNARGSYALKAACDFEIKCSAGELEFVKMKDGELPNPIEFKLIPTQVGISDEGEPVTSCHVEYGEKSFTNRVLKQLSRFETIALDALITVCKKENRKLDDGRYYADMDKWRTEFYKQRRIEDNTLSKNALSLSFKRVTGTGKDAEGLLEKGIVGIYPEGASPLRQCDIDKIDDILI